MLEAIHSRYVHQRRVTVLSRHIAEILPPKATVLDVGCGDGRLTRLVQQQRRDLSLKGLDVLVRSRPEFPVTLFDGTTLPYGDRSIDIVMFVDVLHHTTDPMQLLREAARVARGGILIKDHLRKGLLAGLTLRFMDRIGNRKHGVALPNNYWKQKQWDRAWADLDLTPAVWKSRLGLYPTPANWIFERSLHFVALLRRATKQSSQGPSANGHNVRHIKSESMGSRLSQV